MPFAQGILKAHGRIPLDGVKEQGHLVVIRYAALSLQFFDEMAHPVFKKPVVFLCRNPYH